MYDIIIVGGGPSGSTLARLLSTHYNILLLEKRSFATDRKYNFKKCCGGLVAPDAQKMLAKFDLGIPKEILVSPQIFYVRAIDLDTNREQSYQRHYLNVDRESFDEWLLSLVNNNVRVIKNAQYVTHQITDNGILITAKIAGDLVNFTSKVLIGADGANSSIREKEYSSSRVKNKYIAVQKEFAAKGDINHFSVFFSKAVTDFYSWLIPKDGKLLIGGAFRPKDNFKAQFQVLLTGIKKHGYEFGEPLNTQGCLLIRPMSNRDINYGSEKVGLVGEAAGFISPSSAEGFSYAFKSAYMLSCALNKGIDGWSTRYKRATQPLVSSIIRKKYKSRVMYNKTLRNLIFKTGVGSIDKLV